jgi:hypothetical protein
MLVTKPGRRHDMEMSFIASNRSAETTRSFDSGSAKSCGEINAPLAFAQDDGIFKTDFPPLLKPDLRGEFCAFTFSF